MKKSTRILYTIFNLKPIQIYYLILYRFFQTPRIIPFKEPVSLNHINLKSHFYQKPSTVDGVTFFFLRKKGDILNGWNNPIYEKLWLYKLHYLDDLNSTEANSNPNLANSLVSSWIAHNSDFKGNGWEPYTLSLRIVNLLKWLSRTKHNDNKILVSIATQTNALDNLIEYHIQGNHLFSNAKALIFSGLLLNSPRSSYWLSKGLRILDKELSKQFLADGAHFELSPMYHAILLWDICDLINVASMSQISELNEHIRKWTNILSKGIVWLEHMVHPDKDISFFNDAAFNVAPSLKLIKTYANDVCKLFSIEPQLSDYPSCAFNKDSGYASIYLSPLDKAILDLANVGPAFQPGHAHADTFSFELSLWGRRVFVNSGTSIYGASDERQRQRSTRAHNTLEINGTNSSDVWSGFRVGKRARVFIEYVDISDGKVRISAKHDGYSSLTRRLLHTRTWNLTYNSLIIEDHISIHQKATARLFIHPEVICNISGERILLKTLEGEAEITFIGASSIELEPSTWHPEFGVTLKNLCIKVEIADRDLVTNIFWS